jgi:HEAT repeat protein
MTSSLALMILLAGDGGVSTRQSSHDITTVAAGSPIAAGVATAAGAAKAFTVDLCARPSAEAWQKVRQRLAAPRNQRYLEGATWALMHGALPSDSMPLLEAADAFTKAVKKKETAKLSGSRGPCGASRTMLSRLDGKDPPARAFAAIFLGVIGDARLAPRLTSLLNDNDQDTRYAAAIAAGLLGDREQSARLLTLLSSPAADDRSGAALGLAEMGATEQAPAIAALLARSEDERVRNSAIVALVVLGSGARFADAIGKVMLEGNGDDVVTAVYALAAIGARSQADAMAKLLDRRFQRGAAAKALALLGASEHAAAIASLLSADDPLVRQDAALALGILKAKSYEEAVAARLDDPTEFVRRYAAYALLLMGSGLRRDACLAIIDPAEAKGYRLNAGDLHPLVSDRLAGLEDRIQAARGH